MTPPKKELTVACNYLLRLMKAHVELSPEQILMFKRAFHDTLTKRFVGHWFPATPHRGSAYRCLQTKHWKDPVLRSIAERSSLPLHRYLPAMFTIWIDPGEVAICFGDEGTWCPVYKRDNNGQIHQTYSDGEETVSSLSSDEDLLSLTQNVQTWNLDENSQKNPIDSRSSSSLTNSSGSRASSPYFNTQLSTMNEYNYPTTTTTSKTTEWNNSSSHCWPSQQQQQQQTMMMSDNLLSYHSREH